MAEARAWWTCLTRRPRVGPLSVRRWRHGGLPPAPDFVDLHDALVLVADDVADTGLTLASVHDFCAGKVGTVRTATIYAKPRSVVRPDYVWRDTDRWITFPWSDRPPVTGQGVRDG